MGIMGIVNTSLVVINFFVDCSVGMIITLALSFKLGVTFFQHTKIYCNTVEPQ